MIETNSFYLKDMEGIKERAESGYNPPKHIQYQHKFTLIRRFTALEKILTTEQFEKMKELSFDIYPYKDWLNAFYKKNKLPITEQAVEKKQMELRSKTNSEEKSD